MMTIQGVGMAAAGFLRVHLVVVGSGVLGTGCVLAPLAEVRATATATANTTATARETDRSARRG
ncbi:MULTISPECIES: hypothetical protein [Streptomyces]|uniref:hypothetical protein n=1 Tax=Streptomyces TaxID=1883 RepID=UPI001678A63E|nr:MULTISPECIES: hypothetical protein [Streptomyces]GGT99814.1 hypothetical protein GCM10010272_50830 [Streptomyces lateritius]